MTKKNRHLISSLKQNFIEIGLGDFSLSRVEGLKTPKREKNRSRLDSLDDVTRRNVMYLVLRQEIFNCSASLHRTRR